MSAESVVVKKSKRPPRTNTTSWKKPGIVTKRKTKRACSSLGRLLQQPTELRLCMNNCIKCNAQIPNRTIVDGKTRNTSNRRFCLLCSSFKSKHGGPIVVGTVGVCDQCGREYVPNRNAGHRLRVCNSCRHVERRGVIKAKAVVFLGGRCVGCGYNKCIRSLNFHHINPGEKDFGIGGHNIRNWAKVKGELKKCILVCANCHGEIHAGIRDFTMGILLG